ncbi:MAG: hypothetical protein PUC06_09315 [Oscillospiraceae bacterium]|nr:hypothetical protein [Oscillospiraceae bacterium]
MLVVVHHGVIYNEIRQTKKFITGQADIDDQWDTYVATCKSMGYDELQEITQASVSRYLGK